MKIVKGKVKLDKRDYRVGNFVYSDEGDYIKMQDINRTVVHRIEKRIAKGQLLDMMLSAPEEHKKGLECYAVMMYNVLCVVPDPVFYNDMSSAVLACVNRHKNIYGIKEDISDEEDKAILREEREFHEAMSDIVEKVGDGGPDISEIPRKDGEGGAAAVGVNGENDL